MKKNFAFGILLVWAFCVLTISTASVSAQKTADTAAETESLLSTTVVISQVYSGGGGTTGTYFNDYVELKNISTTPQSLNGLFLAYGSATGQFASVASNSFALPNVTLNPGQYFLVQTSNAGTGGVVLPVTPDATTTGLTMAAASGKVALVTSAFTNNTCGATATPCPLPSATIIDLVSYGVSNNAEGGATVNNGVALTSTQGSVRKANGCTETDNNNADFDVVTAPVPRNSSSSVNVCGAAPTSDALGDFNGDGRSDWNVVRNTGGGPNGQITWFIQNNGSSATTFVPFGIATDTFTPEDFDGDGKDDIAVWRADPSLAYFYILQSSNNTVRAEQFGITGDNPKVIGDYDGDGKADVAVFRPNGTAIDPCGVGKATWYYRPSGTPGVSFRYDCWGKNGDFPAPGDYDGDGKNDFVVQQATGIGNSAVFQLKKSAGGIEQVYWGTTTDRIVQGDYDGDAKTDFCVVRGSGGVIQWNILERDGGGTGASPINFGLAATDFPVAGDFDGDGKADVSVWRPSATAGATSFFIRRSTDAGLTAFSWGQTGDYPVNNTFTN